MKTISPSQRLEGLINAIADGLRTPGTLGKLQDIESRKAELEARLASSPPETPVLHPNLAQLYRKKVERLHDSLQSPSLKHEALEILRGPIDDVRITATEVGLEIELVGDIAQMVSITNVDGLKTKRAALDEETARSVKVVAGAGFEPATFRL